MSSDGESVPRDLNPADFGSFEERIIEAACNSSAEELQRQLEATMQGAVNCQQPGTGNTPLHIVLKNLIMAQELENRDETTPHNVEMIKDTLSVLRRFQPRLDIPNTAGETAGQLMQQANFSIAPRTNAGDLQAVVDAWNAPSDDDSELGAGQGQGRWAAAKGAGSGAGRSGRSSR